MKKVIITLILTLLLGVLFLYKYFPPIDTIKVGMPKTSYSKEKAIELDVFLAEFIASKDSISIGTYDLRIIEAWTEYSWWYSDFEGNIEKGRDIEFVIRFRDNVNISSARELKIESASSSIISKQHDKITLRINKDQDYLDLKIISQIDTIPLNFHKKQ